MTRILRPVLISVIATAAAVGAAFAADPVPSPLRQCDWGKARLNYVAALHTGNEGAKMCAARLLAEYRMKETAGELIEMLQRDPSESVRMSAALALVTLNVKEGREAVAEASLYDGSDRVAEFCRMLLEAYPPASASASLASE